MKEVANILVIIICLGITNSFGLFILGYYLVKSRKTLRQCDEVQDQQFIHMQSLLQDMRNLHEEVYTCRKMMKQEEDTEATLILDREPITPEAFNRTLRVIYTKSIEEELVKEARENC